MPGDVYNNMEYIQNLFLGVQGFAQRCQNLEDLIAYLDAEPPAFRSVAYESASMECALRDFSNGNQLQEWEKFYQQSGKAHAFHVEIGLGWAFAKAQRSPDAYPESLNSRMRWMVFDGIGYYSGLFRGRKTVRGQQVPEGIAEPDLQGFDQGLGRRLWYMAKGEVPELSRLLQPFLPERLPALWRGVGIACGYVGGNEQAALALLKTASDAYLKQLCTGITLAAMSRRASDSAGTDVEMACWHICALELAEIPDLDTIMPGKFGANSDQDYSHWIRQLEMRFE